MDLTKNKVHAGLLSLFICLPVLFRGLYFAQDMFAFFCLALLWVRAFAVINKKSFSFGSLLDWTLLIFCAGYLVSSAFSVSRYAAITEALKYFSLFLVYLLIKNSFKKNYNKTLFFEILIYVLAISSVISLLTAAGVINFEGSYSDSPIEKWLNGTVQYHNAFGILMLAGFFAASSINSNAVKSIKFLLLGICSYFLMFGLIMSYSRGAWVLVPVVAVLFLLFSGSEEKLRFFGTGISSLAGVMAVLPAFSKFVEEKSMMPAVLLLFAGLVLSVALYYGVNILLKKLSALKHFKAVSISIIAIVVIFAILIVLMPQSFPFLPDQLAQRLEGISFEGGTVKERMVFYNDAFNLYKDYNLVFGSGGGAWQYMYGMYQSYLYYTSQAHSYIMQVLVEAGAVGFILWALVIILFFVQIFRAKKTADKNTLCAIACVGTALIIHSFIDFDLSLPAILLILWVMFAFCDTSAPEITKEFKLNKVIIAITCVILLVFSALFLIGNTAYNKGVEILNGENADKEAISKQFNIAATAVPFSTEYKIADYVYTTKVGASIDSEQIDAFVSQDAFNIRTYEHAYAFYNKVGDYETCMALVEKVIALHPLNPDNYVTYASLIEPTLRHLMEMGDFYATYDKAEEICKKKDVLLEMAAKSPENQALIQQSVNYAETIASMLKGI